MAVKENFCKQIRLEVGMTGAELARRSGITPATLNGFEKKRHNLSDEVLVKLAKALRVKPEKIAPGANISNNPEDMKLISKAVKLTHQYFNEEEFGEDLMTDISTKVYNLLVDYERMDKNENSISIMEKNLKKDFYRGKAAKCFLDLIINKTNF